MGNITDTVKTLIILNVIFFVGSMLLSPGTAESLFIMYFPASPNFKVWQPLTHMFMHGSISHIFFNMFNLFMFGSILERSLGANKFLFLYFSAGFGALALHLTIDYSEFIPILSKIIESGYSKDQAIELMAQNRMLPGGMLGASGAVSGLFMAFAVIYPNLPLQIMFIPVPIKRVFFNGFIFCNYRKINV